MIQAEWYCDKCKAKHFGNCPKVKVTMTTTTTNSEQPNRTICYCGRYPNCTDICVQRGHSEPVEPNQLDELFDRTFGEHDSKTIAGLVLLKKDLKSLIAKAQEQAISDYQTNFEQIHIAEAIKIAKQEGYKKGWNKYNEAPYNPNETYKKAYNDLFTRLQNAMIPDEVWDKVKVEMEKLNK